MYLGREQCGLKLQKAVAMTSNKFRLALSLRAKASNSVLQIKLTPVRAKAEIECRSSWIPVLLKASLMFLNKAMVGQK